MRASRYLFGLFWWGLTCLTLTVGAELSLVKLEAGIPLFGLGTFYLGITFLWLVNWVVYILRDDA